MTQLVDKRPADETRGAGNEYSHGRRVYWRVCALLAAVLLAGGCDSSKPEPPPPSLTFRQLDAQQQRLVGDYEPVSRALTSYEIDYRNWRAGRLQTGVLVRHARTFRGIVGTALGRVRRDPVSGETARAKALLVAALAARSRALQAPPRSKRYRNEWNRSVVDARRGLTKLQDIRDRARLIPLPEDSVS